MGTKTTVALGVASGALCTLAVTEGILPRIEDRALDMPVASSTVAPERAVAPAREIPETASVPLAPGSARAAAAERRPLDALAAGPRTPEDLRRLLFSSERIDQVRAIELLVADGSAEAHRVLLDALSRTSDRVLLALLEEALLECAPAVAPAVIDAYLASDDPSIVGRLSRLLAGLAGARPELEAQVIEHFLEALQDPHRFPARASAASGALAALGAAAADELRAYLADRDASPEGVGSAVELIARLPDGDVVRETLAESLHGSRDILGEPGLSAEEREMVLEKTGSLAWFASLRPDAEHDRLAEVLLESLLAARDPKPAGSLAWGLSNLKGLSDGARVETSRSLLAALESQSDDALRQQYLLSLHRLAAIEEHPPTPAFHEIVRLIEDARARQGADGWLGPRLDSLLAQLRAHEEKEGR